MSINFPEHYHDGIDINDKYRHECEVRYVLKLPSNRRRHQYLDGVRKQRGNAAADRLYNDAKRMMEEFEVHSTKGKRK